MKNATLVLWFILISVAALAKTEDRLDSLIQTIIESKGVDIKAADLLGEWSKNGGFFTQKMTFKKNNLFASSNLMCIGKARAKGRWMVDEKGIISLQRNNQTAQLYVGRIDSQIYLWTEEEIQEIKALTVDYLKLGKLQTAAEMEAFIKEGLIKTTYKKTAP